MNQLFMEECPLLCEAHISDMHFLADGIDNHFAENFTSLLIRAPVHLAQTVNMKVLSQLAFLPAPPSAPHQPPDGTGTGCGTWQGPAQKC